MRFFIELVCLFGAVLEIAATDEAFGAASPILVDVDVIASRRRQVDWQRRSALPETFADSCSFRPSLKERLMTTR